MVATISNRSSAYNTGNISRGRWSNVVNLGAGGGRNKAGYPPAPPLNAPRMPPALAGVPVLSVVAPPAPGVQIGGPQIPSQLPANAAAQQVPSSGTCWDVLEEQNSSNGATSDVKEHFVFSARPQSRTLFPTRNATAHDFLYDCQGAPYCGPVAVCVALGIDPKLEEMKEWNCDVENGTIGWLANYCLTRGVNLHVKVVASFELGIVGGEYTFPHAPSFKWVRLVLNKGHYYLVTSSVASEAPLPKGLLYIQSLLSGTVTLRAFLTGNFRGFLSNYSIRSVSTSSDEDQRQLSERRDSSVFADELAVVTEETYDPTGLAVITAISVLCSLVSWYVLTGVLIYCIVFIGSAVAGSIIYIREEREYLISVMRLHECVTSMINIAAVGGDTKLAISRLFSNYRINTPLIDRERNVLADTQTVAMMISSQIECGVYARNPITVMNRPNDQIFADKLKIIEKNQLCGVKGKGNNHFARLPKVKHVDVKRDIPVAVAPVGGLLSEDGMSGPGFISVTDDAGVIASFAVRGMTKEKNDDTDGPKWDMIFKSTEYMRPHINSTPNPGPEPTVQEAYRSNNIGKKSTAQIDRDLRDYEEYKSGICSAQTRSKVTKNGCFNKFESNVKMDHGEPAMKARMIMVMSLVRAVELSPLLYLIHAFNKSSFSKHQVKNLTPEEMSERVESVSNKAHTVTDYSSYESSIDEDYRMIENHTLKLLCSKFGYVNTVRAIEEHCVKGRFLYRGGIKIWLETRCSGDYYTSFGNGILSYCIMRYCAEINGLDPAKFDGIFEGDDGLVGSDVPNLDVIAKLGFKFSIAIQGVKPGDCDFLSSRFMNGKRFLNTPKYLSGFMWVKTGGKKLKRSKILYIWRCMGASLYYLSPGHPVLTALVNYIGKVTAGVNAFKGADKFIDPYKFKGYKSSYPRDVVVDETMRDIVAQGSQDFTPISIPDQLLIEKSISNGVFHVGQVFRDDAGFMEKVACLKASDGDSVAFDSLMELLERASVV